MPVYVPAWCKELDPNCPLLPQLQVHRDGYCDNCGKELPVRRRRWCSNRCANEPYANFSLHHDWKEARAHALERDGYKCVKCGTAEVIIRVSRTRTRSNLEVNHIAPRRGRGYGRGCHNHQSNLETLCVICHQRVTAEQRRSLLT